MQKKKVSAETTIKEKIQYLGLNFEKVPKTLIATDKLGFNSLKGFDEKQYKQYKYVKVSDIDILLTPKHRLDSLGEKYDEASPLYMYFDSKHEKNVPKYTTFLNMLKKVEISEVEKIAEEQELLAKEIPYRVKYNGNYLWQVYYSETAERYFMLVPTEDTDYSTFFYLLKKKIENKKNEKIFIPISYLDYSGDILTRSEIKDLENYLWLFTKDYPNIYEVYNSRQKQTLQIIGETEVYGKIKSLYKMVYSDKKDAIKYYKLLKALFILQVELPHYFELIPRVNKKGELELYFEKEKIEYNTLLDFVKKQYKKSIEQKEQNNKDILELKRKLKNLKREETKLEQDYVEKEKIISTYLECKKSFFGRVKYYFKYGKSVKKVNKKGKEKKEENQNNEEQRIEKKEVKIKNYTLDELIVSFKELEITENEKKSIVQDINAIKLKNKNLKKKIENATLYINEINEHKKSIFEFWKYSNKDEVSALEEGEAEEVNVSKIERYFDFDKDFEKFGESVDKSQRLKFTDSELDSSFVASTSLIDTINEISTKKNLRLDDFNEILEKLKSEKDLRSDDEEENEFDILGRFNDDEKKERSIGSKIHRETPRNIYNILDIKNDTTSFEFKRSFVNIIKNLRKALNKNTLDEDMYVYKATNSPINLKGLQLLSLNEEKELNECYEKNNIITEESFLDKEKNEIYLYKIKLNKGINFIAISNIVLYNNKNMTLPVGMNESNNIIVNMDDLEIKEVSKEELNINRIRNEKDDFSDLILYDVQILEYNTNKKDEN